jgi:hypothetical protein
MLGKLTESEKEQPLFEYSLSYSNALTKNQTNLLPQAVTIARPIQVNALDFLVNEVVDVQV